MVADHHDNPHLHLGHYFLPGAVSDEFLFPVRYGRASGIVLAYKFGLMRRKCRGLLISRDKYGNSRNFFMEKNGDDSRSYIFLTSVGDGHSSRVITPNYILFLNRMIYCDKDNDENVIIIGNPGNCLEDYSAKIMDVIKEAKETGKLNKAMEKTLVSQVRGIKHVLQREGAPKKPLDLLEQSYRAFK